LLRLSANLPFGYFGIPLFSFFKNMATNLFRPEIFLLCYLAGKWAGNSEKQKQKAYDRCFKGIVSRDWKGLQMVSMDRFEV
jgi:hypothetical protein